MTGRPLPNGTGNGGGQNTASASGSSAAPPIVRRAVAEALARPASLQLWGPGFLGVMRLDNNGQLRYDVHQSASTDSQVIQTIPVARVKGYSEGARACRRLRNPVDKPGLSQLVRRAIADNRIGPSNQPEFINGFGLGFRATATQHSETHPNAPSRYIGPW